MSDIQCGKFKPRGWRSEQGRIATWSATITPAPTGDWKAAFAQALATEGAMGNTAGANLRIEGGVVEFDAPEMMAQAAANTIHRSVEKANAATARREADRQKQREATRKQSEDAAGDLGRLKDKYKDGL